MDQYRETFNDGVLVYGHKTTQRSQTGKRIGEVFTAEGKLYYREMSCRQSDYELANASGSKLDIKVKTPYPPSFRKINKNKLLIQIDGEEYESINVDHDASKLYLFFYLQKVGGKSE
ncbi:phage head closure protein [Cytobacillus oceanisediminis]|uniref:phage head closure protein n=1 Tax=Cytobacillus oceanisediminis TaxID=665099 RepID=UPI001FB4AC52|nr:phage head closure protein [Cytobacillus oceanisediminis]UOE54921.1 phage head closure protein [Cytobacillus oceanisediminis]